MANKAEVKNMWITEYDQERAFEDQWAAGKAEGKLEALAQLVAEGIITPEFVTLWAGLSEEEFLQKTGLRRPNEKES